MMKKNITKAYIFLVQIMLSVVVSFRIYYLWSKLYSFLFVSKRNRMLLPTLHSESGVDTIQIPLDRVVKIPYVADGPKELWDVCQPPGVVESRILAVESGEPHDAGAMDCDDYARYMANSIESQHAPLLLSVLCIDRRDMKWGILPKFPGHMVCILTDNPSMGDIYHVGNWSQTRSTRNDIIGARNFRYYSYSNISGLALDLTRAMAGDTGDMLAWIIMDHNLHVCAWGMGGSSEVLNSTGIDLRNIKSKTLIG
jgi:hypothetical protein